MVHHPSATLRLTRWELPGQIDPGARARLAVNAQPRADETSPLLHPGEPEVFLREGGMHCEPLAIIAYKQPQFCLGEGQLCADFACLCMPQRIRQRLLPDPQEVIRHLGRERARLAVEPEGDG